MVPQNENQLPPIIVEYIKKLRESRTPKPQRDITCVMLERVRDACDQAIKQYEFEMKTKK